MPEAAILVQNSAALVPTRGMLMSHAGGGGILNVASAFTHTAICSEWVTIALMASPKGTIKTQKITMVINVIASERRPQSRVWRAVMSGQVDTTRVVAQIAGPRKGLRIQREVPIRPPMKSTANTVLVMSRWFSFMAHSFAGFAWVCLPHYHYFHGHAALSP